ALSLTELGSTRHRPSATLGFPPGVHLRVVAVLQDVRNPEPPKFRGPGGLGIFEAAVEGVAEGFFPRRLRVTETPGHKTDQRFNGGHGRDLASSEDKVPERKLEIDEAPHPLIEPLI